MKKLTPDEMHRLTVDEFRSSEKLPLTVVLDNVRSQNNIGSVFRTADAFRVEHIALCGITATPPHREIHKTALGAEDSVAWSHHDDTAACVRALKDRGYTVYAVEIAHDSIMLGTDGFVGTRRAASAEACAADSGRGTPRPYHPMAIVLGNEIDGVQEEVMALCDGALEIPQEGTKHSLNVSCAAAIVIWECYKMLRPIPTIPSHLS